MLAHANLQTRDVTDGNAQRTGARYVIVSPIRDERKYLPDTIAAVARQTILPIKWVLVDDGSTDGTEEYLRTAAEQYAFIEVVTRPNRGFRHSGAGVVEAFYVGYDKIKELAWDYIIKLDGDLSFEPTYFADCFREFDLDPKLGIAGGTVCKLVNGSLEPESKIDPVFHVRGATKIYKAECWRNIGGLLQAPGWDGIDEVKANMLGWTTRTLPGIKLRHFRPAGHAYGQWKDWRKGGLGNYIAGYHPVFMMAKCARRLLRRPVFVGSCGLLVGYLGGYLKRVPQVEKDLIKFIRREQVKRMLGRKSLWVQ